jgi:hypothetical protein
MVMLSRGLMVICIAWLLSLSICTLLSLSCHPIPSNIDEEIPPLSRYARTQRPEDAPVAAAKLGNAIFASNTARAVPRDRRR